MLLSDQNEMVMIPISSMILEFSENMDVTDVFVYLQKEVQFFFSAMLYEIIRFKRS